MIHELSKNIALAIKSQMPNKDVNIEVCTYGIELIISDIIAVLLLLLWAILTETFLYTSVFLITFIVFRHQAGGYHASSHLKCNFIFFSVHLIFTAIIMTISYKVALYMSILLIAASVCICFKYAPVSHPNRPITNKQREKFRKRSVILLLFMSVITLAVMVGTSMYKAAFSCIIGMFCVSISLVAEIIRQKSLS